MGIEISIEREPEISLEEWLAAVQVTDSMRIDLADVVAENPKTGETIRIKSAEGDVAIYREEDEDWIKAIFFFKGRGTFRYPDGWELDSNPVRIAATRLVDALTAKVLCEGEECL